MGARCGAAGGLDSVAAGSIPSGRRVAGGEEGWGRVAGGAPVTGGGGDGGVAAGGQAENFSEEQFPLPASISSYVAAIAIHMGLWLGIPCQFLARIWVVTQKNMVGDHLWVCFWSKFFAPNTCFFGY